MANRIVMGSSTTSSKHLDKELSEDDFYEEDEFEEGD